MLLTAVASTAEEPNVVATRAEKKTGAFMLSKRQTVQNLDWGVASGSGAV